MTKKLKYKLDHHISIINAIDDSQFVIRNSHEILAYLKQIQQNHALLALTFPSQHYPFISRLQKIDELRHRVIFDAPDDPALDHHFLNQEPIAVVTSIDRVQIQFDLSNLYHVSYDSKKAYAASFPAQLLRLQRREVYRLTVPVNAPVYCEIVDSAYDTEGPRRYPIYDISFSGIGLNHFPVMSAGTEVHNVIVHLPHNVGSFMTDIVVCHTFSVRFRRQNSIVKTGFKFLASSEKRDRMIQHYTANLFSERRLKEMRMEKKPLKN